MPFFSPLRFWSFMRLLGVREHLEHAAIPLQSLVAAAPSGGVVADEYMQTVLTLAQLIAHNPDMIVAFNEGFK